MSSIVNVGPYTIDLDRVVFVGPIGGDSNWLRYIIHFDSKSVIEIYEKRMANNSFPRAKFIQLWQDYKEGLKK